MSLDSLKETLKPVPKAKVKVSIDGYKCRTASTKSFKTLDHCTETEREIALNRQKIIAAYERTNHQDGLSVKQFVTLYNQGKVLPEVRKILGDWGYLKDWRRFYDTWLKPYATAGLSGLVPQYKKRGGPGSSLGQEMKDLLEYLYLDTNQPGIADVVRHIQQVYEHTEISEITAHCYLMNIPSSAGSLA